MRVQPDPVGTWVNLEDRLGIRSTQRQWISDVADGVVMVT
jgi:hypothetical protein